MSQRILGFATLLAVGLFILAPLVMVLIASIKVGGNPWSAQPFTLAAYGKALDATTFWRGAGNSLQIAVVSTLISLSVGTGVAYGIDRGRFRGRDLLRTIFISPLSLPRVVIGMALFIIYLSFARPLYDTIPSIVLAHCLLLLPFVVTIVGAGLTWVDPRLEEAARDLGDTGLQAIVGIVLPILTPALLAAAGLSLIISFDEVDTTIFLIRSNIQTLPIEVLNYAQNHQDGTVAAVSVIILGSTVLFAAAVFLTAALLLRRRGSALPLSTAASDR